MNEQTPEKQSSRKILLTIFIIVLIALNGVLLYLNIKNRDENTVLTQQRKEVQANLDLTEAKLDSISNELDVRIAEVQKLGGDVEALTQAKEQLEKDKSQLKNANAAERRRLNEKIKGYEELLVSKDEEISRLKVQNEELYSENNSLKTKTVRLADSINTIDKEKRQLAEKVNIASALKAENLEISAINERGKERDKGEYRAKQIDRIKVAFNLGENNVAKVETKNIYMRLIEPDGAAVFDMATGGGTFVFEGQETFFTAKQEILFDNTRQPVSFVFNKGTPYKTGKHIVELYSDGFKIGQGSFVVK
jgi:cell division protein ZapB